jgi:hypothetical protein
MVTMLERPSLHISPTEGMRADVPPPPPSPLDLGCLHSGLTYMTVIWRMGVMRYVGMIVAERVNNTVLRGKHPGCGLRFLTYREGSGTNGSVTHHGVIVYHPNFLDDRCVTTCLPTPLCDVMNVMLTRVPISIHPN